MTDMPDLPSPSKGLARVLYRLPIGLYRVGLGALLGNRFLLLNHTGRVTGLPRQAVLEVIRHDAERGRYFVVAGFGERSDWLQNIKVEPRVVITAGRKSYPARAERLDVEQGQAELLDYARRHPIVLRMLVRLLGMRIKGTEEEIRNLSRHLRVVAFQVLPTS